mmetsp:Transcript_30091/g.65020  ORF Transcript_30091/g.65020 Transcript_30091/m.65020 type:complete len:258 (+) Transcript_30091:127-900(+)
MSLKGIPPQLVHICSISNSASAFASASICSFLPHEVSRDALGPQAAPRLRHGVQRALGLQVVPRVVAHGGESLVVLQAVGRILASELFVRFLVHDARNNHAIVADDGTLGRSFGCGGLPLEARSEAIGGETTIARALVVQSRGVATPHEARIREPENVLVVVVDVFDCLVRVATLVNPIATLVHRDSRWGWWVPRSLRHGQCDARTNSVCLGTLEGLTPSSAIAANLWPVVHVVAASSQEAVNGHRSMEKDSTSAGA